MRIANSEKRSYQNFRSTGNQLIPVTSTALTVVKKAVPGASSTPPPLPITNLRVVGSSSKAGGAVVSVLAFPWRHKVLSTIAGLIFGIKSCVSHNAHLAKLEKALDMKILQEHGMLELAKKCETDPDAFYQLIPTNNNRLSDETELCYSLLVDRAVAMDAGREVQRLAAQDKANGRKRQDLSVLMDEQYMRRLKELRGTNSDADPIFVWRTDKRWYNRDKARELGEAIYNGGDIETLVTENIVFKWSNSDRDYR